MTNQMRFDQLEYYSDPIKKEVQFNFLNLPIHNMLQEYVITRSEVGRQDNLLIAMEGITNEEGYFVQLANGY